MSARRDYVRLCQFSQFSGGFLWFKNTIELRPKFSSLTCNKLAISTSRTPCRFAYTSESRRKCDDILL
ncbi:MAG: hypothetical protein DWI22_18405 [Planctomycetota bacterium]|nr:MAG: hypothetical protein DWI22_18405 [Planctomycetota bacterium]